ncbi:MAG TPA: beta-ketoacyl-ACP synthase II [Anaerolineales bacterium]
MRKRVVLTGLGCISPLGQTVDETWQAVLDGRSGAGPITHFDASTHKTRFAAEVKGFDAVGRFGAREARRMDRFVQFAIAAAEEAMADARFQVDESNRERVGIIIGTGIGGIGTMISNYEVLAERGADRVSPFLIPMMISDSAAGILAIRTGARALNMSIATACATGTNSLGEAASVIQRGTADVMLVGSSEAAIVPLTMAGLNAMTALSTRNDAPERASRPFDRERDGFLMGEGAAMVVLESLESAERRGARIICEFTGYGTSDDAYHISAPAEDGAGASLSMQLALEDAGLVPADIGYINAHGTSTHLNDRSETLAVKRVFGEQAYRVPISSTKSMTGHLLGASGSLEAVICARAITSEILPPTINYEFPDPECDLDYVPNKPREASPRHVMSNSFGFGGHNATLILSKYTS